MEMFSKKQLLFIRSMLKKYGAKPQCAMLQEECLELAMALHKYLNRYTGSEQDFNNIHAEIADVLIMLEQAKVMFSESLIKYYVDKKLYRQKKRMSSQ